MIRATPATPAAGRRGDAPPRTTPPLPMARRAAPHRGLDTAEIDALQGSEDRDSRPSKTVRKSASHDLQKLGLALAELSDARLAATAMPESLRDAIEQFRRTRTHEGRRRQLQYVGKLMRGVDDAPLREAVAEAQLGSARETLALHEAERWRAELIADDAALQRWITAHPDTDSQHLRSLVRAARRDAAGLPPEARQPRSSRELFQYLKPVLAAAATAA
jgi:ribosome-associated protein